jgi:hypothetical protein
MMRAEGIDRLVVRHCSIRPDIRESGNMSPITRRLSFAAGILAALGVVSSAYAADYTGTISMLEVWDNGNVAFRLAPEATTCNTQFVINSSSLGLKNLYAAVLAAKKTGTPIRVVTYACGPADGFGGSSYNIPVYIYELD